MRLHGGLSLVNDFDEKTHGAVTVGSTPDAYLTIEGPSEGLYKEKGSKFLAFASPVGSEAEAKALLSDLKKRHFDARHHCYAWVIGAAGVQYRAFDDGEPSHSAGDPILGQIRSRGLTNILVAVVRYFGGTKLGVGGLVSAYKTAAADAIAKAVVVRREVAVPLRLVYPYDSTPAVMKLVKTYDLTVVEQAFDADCSLTATVPQRNYEGIREQVHLLNATGTHIRLQD